MSVLQNAAEREPRRKWSVHFLRLVCCEGTSYVQHENYWENTNHEDSGIKIASDGLRGRVFEVSLGGLQNDEVALRKFKLIIEIVQGKNCLTARHKKSMSFWLYICI